MLAIERLEKIKNILLAKKNVSVTTLKELLPVSDVTIRKDLATLEEEGFLIKTRGGATLVEKTNGNLVDMNIHINNYKKKQMIATLAAETIQDGDSIFLGSGSTCYMLAQKIKNKNISVVTNNINILNVLVPFVKNVYLIGGEMVYSGNMISSSSEKLDEYLRDIYVNKAYTSILGVDLMAGLTVDHSLSVFIYKTLPNIAKEWFLLTDYDKYNKIRLYNACSLEAPSVYVSDKIPQEYEEYFTNKNIKVMTPTINTYK